MCKLSKLPGEEHSQRGEARADRGFQVALRGTSRLAEPMDASGAKNIPEKFASARHVGEGRDVKIVSD